MKVSDLLSLVKANRYTYYNLDKSSISMFQEMYNYLKRNEDKNVPDFCKKQVQNILDKKDLSYLNKYSAMLRINRMML